MASLVVKNADIRTCDARKPRATAFAVQDGKFLAVGPTKLIENEFIGENTRVIDAHGNTVVPGFTDAHTHLTHGTELYRDSSVDFKDIDDPKEWLRLIKEAGARIPKEDKNPWIVGGRWDITLLKEGQGLPTLDEVDEVLPPHVAMCLFDIDFHSIWINRRAFQLIGVTEDTPNPEGGEMVRDEQGRLTGEMKETAQALVMESEAYLNRDSHAEFDDLLKLVFQHFNSLGVTSCHEMAIEPELYEAQIKSGSPMTLRILCGQMCMKVLDMGKDYYESVKKEQKRLNELAKLAHERNKIGPEFDFGFMKFFVDGTLANYTAALWEDYADREGFKGTPFNSADNLNRAVKLSYEEGFPVAIHAIGDKSVSMALDALIDSPNPQNCSKRIEHLEMIHQNDFIRLAKHNVTASMQPTHCTSGCYQLSRIGKNRLPNSYPWQKLISTGANVAFGSDWPTAEESPMKHLEDAILRVSHGKEYDPDNRLSFDEALYCHTQAGANIAGWGDQLGSITVGKWADFVILPGRINETDFQPGSIADWKAEQTWVGGHLVYESEHCL